MTAPRLTSEFWVSAYKQVLEGQAIPLVVIKKGNAAAGAIIVRISDLQGKSKIFGQSFDMDGDRRWVELAAGKDAEMDTVILRQKKVDSDLWILEVETRHGNHYLDVVSS